MGLRKVSKTDSLNKGPNERFILKVWVWRCFGVFRGVWRKVTCFDQDFGPALKSSKPDPNCPPKVSKEKILNYGSRWAHSSEWHHVFDMFWSVWNWQEVFVVNWWENHIKLSFERLSTLEWLSSLFKQFQTVLETSKTRSLSLRKTCRIAPKRECYWGP